jgi:hypothetical protein
MAVTVECRGVAPDVAPVVEAAIETVVGRIRQRDTQLMPPGDLLILLAQDYSATLGQLTGRAVPEGGVAQAVHIAAGVHLVLDARHVAGALAGEAEGVARLVHLVHRELARLHAAADRAADPALAGLLTGEFERHLYPLAEGMWEEYFSTRRSVWSLPVEADLLLPHLVDLVEVLPAATAEEIALAAGDGSMQECFARTLGRVAHLVQSMGHCQGYLAGLGRHLEAISPDGATRLQASFAGARWARSARMLDALYGSAGKWDADFLYSALLPEVVGHFAGLGLQLQRSEDGGVWLGPLGPQAGQTRQ